MQGDRVRWLIAVRQATLQRRQPAAARQPFAQQTGRPRLTTGSGSFQLAACAQWNSPWSCW